MFKGAQNSGKKSQDYRGCNKFLRDKNIIFQSFYARRLKKPTFKNFTQ